MSSAGSIQNRCRPSAVVAEGLRRSERAEERMSHAVATQRKTEADIGRQHLPTAPLEDLAVELVGLVASPAMPRTRNHGRRENARAAEFTAAPQHFCEAVHVPRGGHDAHPRHLRELFLECAVGSEIAVAEMLRRRVAPEYRYQAPLAQILAQPDRRIFHAKRLEQVLVYDLSIGALLRIDAPQRIAHERVMRERRVFHVQAGRLFGKTFLHISATTSSSRSMYIPSRAE